MIIKPSSLPKGLPKKTISLCPECHRKIKAVLDEEDGAVWMRKKCPEHGAFKELIWSDADFYRRVERWAYDGVGVENPEITDATSCPESCGLCNLHKSHTCLANLDVTNRCNMNCPICFANANAAGYVYEPSFEQCVEMMKNLRAERPVPTVALQFAGGEPTVHPRFLELVAKARELEFPQIQVATNGLKLANDPTYAQKLLDAGMHTVYLQFDSLRDEDYIQARGRKLVDVKDRVIEHCRATKPTPLAVCLVPTIVKGINDDQIGAILQYAYDNIDVIRAVNFQPVAFTGRIDEKERLAQRFTLPDLTHAIEEQTGWATSDDFYPTPCVASLSELVSVLNKEAKVAFTAHPHCGIATYFFIEKDTGKVTPVTRFVDVERLFDDAVELAGKIEGSRFGKLKAATKLLTVNKYLDKAQAPKGINIRKLMRSVLDTSDDKRALSEWNWNSLYVGAMHFQDHYNYDISRLMRCVVHYTTPDGRIIPFCAYNSGPTYRTAVEKKFSIPLEEWKRRRAAERSKPE